MTVKNRQRWAGALIVTLYREDDEAIAKLRASLPGLSENRWQSEVAKFAITFALTICEIRKIRKLMKLTAKDIEACEAEGEDGRVTTFMIHGLRESLDKLRDKWKLRSSAAAMRYCLRAAAKFKGE